MNEWMNENQVVCREGCTYILGGAWNAKWWVSLDKVAIMHDKGWQDGVGDIS